MKFGTFLLRFDGIREAEIKDLQVVVAGGQKVYRPKRQKYLYIVDSEFVDDRFFGCPVNTMMQHNLEIL